MKKQKLSLRFCLPTLETFKLTFELSTVLDLQQQCRVTLKWNVPHSQYWQRQHWVNTLWSVFSLGVFIGEAKRCIAAVMRNVNVGVPRRRVFESSQFSSKLSCKFRNSTSTYLLFRWLNLLSPYCRFCGKFWQNISSSSTPHNDHAIELRGEHSISFSRSKQYDLRASHVHLFIGHRP